MPHQCTNCGRTFSDGSKEMLSGCPDCGGNRFQFAPTVSGLDRDSSAAEPGGETDRPAEGTERSESGRQSSGAVARAASTVRDLVSDDSTDGESTSDDVPEWPETARPPDDEGDGSPNTDASQVEGTGDEDSAQASARSEVVSPDELPTRNSSDAQSPARDDSPSESNPPVDPEETAPKHGRVVSEPTGERPSLEELRDELNDQFESIKIIQPGQYELNLMELYDREEYIVSLQEDGRYVIDVPESWRDPDSP